MGGKNSAPAAPDYSVLAGASERASEFQAQIAKDQLDWAKTQYISDREVVDPVVADFRKTQQFNQTNAEADRKRYEDVYQPQENKMVADADSYSSPERKDLERGRAEANVAQQFESQRQNNIRDLESFGVNPASTRFSALDTGLRAQQAAASAAAANQSDQMVDATGRALRSEAINVGRGYPGQIAGTYNTALQSGTGAVNSQLGATASGANTMGTASQWSGLSGNSLANSANILNTQYQNQLGQFNANQKASSGFGSALGMGAGILSSFIADGGQVQDPSATPGGTVPAHASPPGAIGVDTVPARLTVGEFVIPNDVTGWVGEKQLQKLIEKSREEKTNATAQPQVRAAIPTAPTFQSVPGQQSPRAIPTG